jgi:hypothetical protein
MATLRQPLWSSGQSSWLQVLRSGVDSRSYHMFLEVVGLERGPLSLVNTIEELLEKNSSRSGLENRDYGRRDPSRWQRDSLYPQNMALTSLPSGGRSVGLVRSQTEVTEFVSCFCLYGNTTMDVVEGGGSNALFLLVRVASKRFENPLSKYSLLLLTARGHSP